MKRWFIENKQICYLLVAIVLTLSLFIVPGGMMLVLVGLPVTIGIISYTTRRRQTKQLRRKRDGLCLGCGYDLRATTDRCPECGRQIVYCVLLCNDSIHLTEHFVSAIRTTVAANEQIALALAHHAQLTGTALISETNYAQAADCCRAMKALGFTTKLLAPSGHYEYFKPDRFDEGRTAQCRNCGGGLLAATDHCPACGETLMYSVLLYSDPVHSILEAVTAMTETLVIDADSADYRARQAHFGGYAPVAHAPYADAVVYCKKLKSLGFCTMLHAPNQRHESFVPENLRHVELPKVPADVDPTKLIWCFERHAWAETPNGNGSKTSQLPDGMVDISGRKP